MMRLAGPEPAEFGQTPPVVKSVSGLRRTRVKFASGIARFSGMAFRKMTMDVVTEQLTARQLAEILTVNSHFLMTCADVDNIINNLVIDGVIEALNISINLRDRGRHINALRLLDRIIKEHPKCDLAYYESAINHSMNNDPRNAAWFALRALELNPSNHSFRSLYIRALAVGGEVVRARRALLDSHETDHENRAHFQQIAQFIDFCESYPIQKAMDALEKLKDSGSYLDAKEAHQYVMSAVTERRPFSFVRLGDGEGAWLSFNSYDEGRYGALYDANRRSFLFDWFGSDRLLKDDDFLRFSINLQKEFAAHDLLGIPPAARLLQERGFLSMRGISAAVNVFRFLDIFDGVSGQKLCSNSINLTLNGIGFYQDLLAASETVNLITSQSGLADMLRARGIKVGDVVNVPGDSRNFWRADETGEPLCQYPGFHNETKEKLRSRMHYGDTWLVAAGFVGKSSISVVRERGGIAFDLGSLADHWVRDGLPA